MKYATSKPVHQGPAGYAAVLVEVVSLLWEKPLAFLLFVGVGGLLTLGGIVVYLYSLIPSNPPPQRDM